MSHSLKLAHGSRLIDTAFDALKSKVEETTPSRENTVELYTKFFSPLSGSIQGKPFERFSLTDPTIRTYFTSTTELIQ
jgi:hypothetical protein